MPGRRAVLRRLAALACVPLLGCDEEPSSGTSTAAVDRVWGVHGTRDGRLHKPRVAGFDAQDRLHVCDLTDRVQVFDRDGGYLYGWRMPALNVDGPSGLTVDRLGRVLVADTHFYRVIVFDARGTILQQLGDGVQGSQPGRFGYPTDVVIDRAGNFYVSEYGDADRIQVFAPDGSFVRQWGGHGYEPGEFLRPRALTIDPTGDRLYVADSCNHRIQVFEADGSFVRSWGRRGTGAGDLAFPYDIAFAPDGTLFVCEYGNSRVQRFTTEGKSLGTWGEPGREPGQFDNPCALAVDSRGAVSVIDSGNHRVQRLVP